MALGYIARALARGLAKLGEPSLLDGEPCGNVNLQRDVVNFAGIGDTADDNPVVRYDVAAISAEFNPRVGQALQHPDGTFRLDKLVQDNRYTRHFIVVPTTKPVPVLGDLAGSFEVE
jgi:hypothetical protein